MDQLWDSLLQKEKWYCNLDDFGIKGVVEGPSDLPIRWITGVLTVNQKPAQHYFLSFDPK